MLETLKPVSTSVGSEKSDRFHIAAGAGGTGAVAGAGGGTACAWAGSAEDTNGASLGESAHHVFPVACAKLGIVSVGGVTSFVSVVHDHALLKLPLALPMASEVGTSSGVDWARRDASIPGPWPLGEGSAVPPLTLLLLGRVAEGVGRALVDAGVLLDDAAVSTSVIVPCLKRASKTWSAEQLHVSPDLLVQAESNAREVQVVGDLGRCLGEEELINHLAVAISKWEFLAI